MKKRFSWMSLMLNAAMIVRCPKNRGFYIAGIKREFSLLRVA